MYTDEILKPLLSPPPKLFCHNMCEIYGWTRIVEDEAPGHRGAANFSRVRNELDVFPWPPQSPDLNLVEALWSDMETELRMIHGRSENFDRLQQDARGAWVLIPDERKVALIESMPQRVRAVIEAGGVATPY